MVYIISVIIMSIYINLLTFLIGISASSKVVKCDSRPNVLSLIIDDFRPALGSYGQPVITPNMDQLAAQSVRFTDAHAQQALCAPSRISFLTSRRPDTTRLWDFRATYWRNLPGNFTSLPQHFKDNGYFTASSGKVFHRGACSNFTDDYPTSWSIPAYWPTTKRDKGSKLCPGPDGSLYSYTMCPVNVTLMPEATLPDIQITDYAISVLQQLSRTRRKAKNKLKIKPRVEQLRQKNATPHSPFFLAVGYYKPHLPFRYPEEFKDLYPIETIQMAKNSAFTQNLPPVAWEHWKDVRQGEDIPLSRRVPDYFEFMPDKYHLLMRQAYYATTSYIDYEIGRVLSTLEDEGLADNTVIALFGDHGFQLGEHQEWSKYSNFVSATQVPLMVHVPGVTDKTRTGHRRRKFSFIDPFHRPSHHHNHHHADSEDQRPSSAGLNLSGEYVPRQLTSGFVNGDFVELVDIFPTLADLAGLPVPPLCPHGNSSNVTFCTEGVSLAPLIHQTAQVPSRVRFKQWKNASFSQYPRPTFYPSHKTNTPPISRISIMGYSMRTKKYRYSEWLPFNNSNYQVDWSSPLARELYSYSQDPMENVNVAEAPANRQLVGLLSHQLRQNWRQALPIYRDEDDISPTTSKVIVGQLTHASTRDCEICSGAYTPSVNLLIRAVAAFHILKVTLTDLTWCV